MQTARWIGTHGKLQEDLSTGAFVPIESRCVTFFVSSTFSTWKHLQLLCQEFLSGEGLLHIQD